MKTTRGIGDVVKTMTSIVPVASEAASSYSLTGTAVDRRGYGSCEIVVGTGAVTGSPSAQTVDAKLQESADGSTGWTDVADDAGTTVAITQITAANTDARKSAKLSAQKRYVRLAATVAFTSGSTPKIGVYGAIVLGGAKDKAPQS